MILNKIKKYQIRKDGRRSPSTNCENSVGDYGGPCAEVLTSSYQLMQVYVFLIKIKI